MSTKTFTVVGGLLMALGFFAGSLQGCGSSAADNKALCKKACDKTLMCNPELAPFLTDCEAQCATRMGTSSMPCKNESTIIAKFNECSAKPCDAYQACVMAIPACEGGSTGTGGTTTGTGGKGGSGGSTTGTGGSTSGSGGSGGSNADGSAAAGCEACTKADACCNAFTAGFDAGMCGLAENCNAATGAQRTQAVAVCTMFLGNFATNPSAPAACK
jgi:hypothetical protein